MQSHHEQLAAIRQVMQENSVQMKRDSEEMAAKLKELREAQKLTRENLDILVRTVRDILPRLPHQ